MTDRPLAPETLEGWYALHQVFAVDHAALRAMAADVRRVLAEDARPVLDALARPDDHGWSAIVDIVGSRGDVMLVHFRDTLDALRAAQRRVTATALSDLLRPVYSFLSVTEAGMYHLTASLAREAAERGGEVGDETYATDLARRLAEERTSGHVQRRLYPPLPPKLPYVCFYPMSKKRDAGQNWYTLPLEERSRLMYAHGTTGRRYAGRVLQVVSGAIGLDAWEWGVTLFAADPLDFKKLVTDMRFDEASARYAEFGEFYVGKVAAPQDWLETLLAER